MKTYKGFNSDLTCKGFQYEVGQSYEHEGEIKACESGFHACENPLDVLAYYPPINEEGELQRYCEVEQDGEVIQDETKTVSSRIKINAEIGLSGLINAGVRFILERVKETKSNTGDYSAATNTGDYSAATNTGDYSAATNTGYYSAATNTGDYSAATNAGNCSAAVVTGSESIAVVTGRNSKAKGDIGCWLVLTERNEYGHILGVQSVKVDGEEIKADTYYKLKDGKVSEAE